MKTKLRDLFILVTIMLSLLIMLQVKSKYYANFNSSCHIFHFQIQPRDFREYVTIQQQFSILNKNKTNILSILDLKLN